MSQDKAPAVAVYAVPGSLSEDLRARLTALGLVFVSAPDAAELIVHGADGAGFASAPEPPASDLLTPREIEVLTAIGEGCSNKVIARRLGISLHTVKFYVESVFRKLDAHSRAEAVSKGLMQARRV
ncbi:MAG: response regulator transcription factor [Asticcacaulis sp.]|nr:response regulator transcription factor [Asticcacaulis sp.]